MQNININEDELHEIIVEVCKNNGVRVDVAYSLSEEIIEKLNESR